LDILLTAVAETTAQPFIVLTSDFRVEYANSAFYETFKVTGQETLDRSLSELDNGQWDIPELHALLGDVLARHQHVRDFRVQRDFQTIGPRSMLLNARRIAGDEHRPSMILLAITDVTDRERLENELIARVEFGEKLIDSVREALLILSPDLKVVRANQPFYDIFQVKADETEGRYVYELGNRQWDIPKLRRLLEDILPKEDAFDDYEIEHDFEQIGKRVMLVNARRLDHMPLILLAIRDLTETRYWESRQKIMVGELQHRVKNILANVIAVVKLMQRRAITLDGFIEALEGRLYSLARTQELLVAGPGNAADLHELVRLELLSVGATEGVNFNLDGPAITIPSSAAQVLGMVIHELATNAAKYGALTSDAGKIEIRWSRSPDKEDAEMTLLWRERGVEISTKLNRTGFGTEVLEKSAPYMLGWSASLTMNRNGIEYSLRFPTARL
jgi:two-component sensor histidine kinase/PAS domain-containing protein